MILEKARLRTVMPKVTLFKITLTLVGGGYFFMVNAKSKRIIIKVIM